MVSQPTSDKFCHFDRDHVIDLIPMLRQCIYFANITDIVLSTPIVCRLDPAASIAPAGIRLHAIRPNHVSL